MVRETFAFPDEPRSQEEQEFPLAYGMLVHSRVTQVYVLMSAVYQPQNAYCIEVDGKGTAEFKRQMRLMAECFPNIHGMVS